MSENSTPKIAKEYVARAVPSDIGGYWAEWGAPGMEIDYVYYGNDPEDFDTQEDACNAARRVMIEALNSRYSRGPDGSRVEGKNVRHIRPTADDVSLMVSEIDDNITPYELAEVLGTRTASTPIDWMDGRTDAPFYLRGLLEVFKDPAQVAKFKEAVAPYIIEKPRKDRPPATADSVAAPATADSKEAWK